MFRSIHEFTRRSQLCQDEQNPGCGNVTLPVESGVDLSGSDSQNGYPLPPGKIPNLVVANPKPVPALPPGGTTTHTTTGKPAQPAIPVSDQFVG